MAAMQEITCACGCGRKKMVRTADVKRGWGRYYSKSCKAKAQERRTGQHRRFHERRKYAKEFGGSPQFSRSGEYEGTRLSGMDMSWCDD